MKLIFTKGNSILSRAIRWCFNDPVSHFAIVFDDKVVFHSNLLGTHVQWLGTFLKSSEIVYSLEYSLNSVQEECIYQNIIQNYDNRPYDFRSFLYFAYRGFLYKFFNKPIPTCNPFDDRNSFLCTEIAKSLDNILTNLPKDLSITRPYELYIFLKDKQNG